MSLLGGSRVSHGDYGDWGWKGDWWWWVSIMFFIFFGFWGRDRGYGSRRGSSIDVKKRIYNGVKR